MHTSAAQSVILDSTQNTISPCRQHCSCCCHEISNHILRKKFPRYTRLQECPLKGQSSWGILLCNVSNQVQKPHGISWLIVIPAPKSDLVPVLCMRTRMIRGHQAVELGINIFCDQHRIPRGFESGPHLRKCARFSVVYRCPKSSFYLC